jgi:uncharacterized protein YecE (DUF72 family)
VFDAVEVDSSFYRIPNPAIVTTWRNLTPADFVFTAKFPRRITHEAKLLNVTRPLEWFHRALDALQTKRGPLLLQLPPSLHYEKHFGVLRAFCEELRPDFRYAVEFRHKSWFRDEVYAFLRDRQHALCWAVNQYVEAPPEVTAPFVYLRLVGDRAITQFTGPQRDRSAETREWYQRLEAQQDAFHDAFVFFNNHWTGFGPASVNEFRRLAGLMEQDWSVLQQRGARQASLGEF